MATAAVQMESEGKKRERTRNLVAFWVIGLLNNYCWVMMNAAAMSISSGGVAFVYISNLIPSTIIKVTGPYWFHYFSYRSRVWLCGCFALASFYIVGSAKALMPRLLGVMCASIAAGWGETTFLALTAFYDSKPCLTAWSSGTGMAGIAGFTVYYMFHNYAGLSPQHTLYLGGIWALAYVAVYEFVLIAPMSNAARGRRAVVTSTGDGTGDEDATIGLVGAGSLEEPPSSLNGSALSRSATTRSNNNSALSAGGGGKSTMVSTRQTSGMTAAQRFGRVLRLWPYTVPLFVVYYAEYALQSGVWASIGLPDVRNKHDREEFYELSNWMYQVGVFLSRSSGTIFPIRRLGVLWMLPVAQASLLALFIVIATEKFWWDKSLLILCFLVGLIGGGVYVNAFAMISERKTKGDANSGEADRGFVEFDLSAASMADTVGILLASITGLYIQCWLFDFNGIEGSKIKC